MKATVASAMLMAALLLSATPPGAQWATIAKVVGEEKEQKLASEAPSVTIGMEAYREVLLSGTYLVGPGDEFLIYVSEMEEPVAGRVLAEGGLFIPKVGRVQVGGLRLREAREAVAAAFARTVRVGQVEVELSRLRGFPVSVVGMVKFPGTVTASGVARISEVIDAAGGLMEDGSRRGIRVLRTGEMDSADRDRISAMARRGDLAALVEVESFRVDLTLYEVTGQSAHNPFIEDGDIVVVPVRKYLMRAMDAVLRSDVYEYVDGDRLRDLVTLAMGPAAHYDSTNALLFRYVDGGARQVSLKVDIDGAMAGEAAADIALEPGDWLVARPRPEYQQASTVQLMGEVAVPGLYVVSKTGAPVREVVSRAGGLTAQAALAKARVIRAVPAEEGRDPEFERIVSIPPADWTEDERQYFNMKSREKRGQMVTDFVALLEEGDESQNIQLMPGDVIVVPSLQHTVLVSGQAASPGAVIYDRDYTLWDYIERAGGFGWRASRDVRVIKARTGEIRSASNVKHIEPGDRIWIKEKPVRDYWAIFSQGMNVVGQLSTAALLYVTVF